MSRTLILYLNARSEDPILWALSDSAHAAVEENGRLEGEETLETFLKGDVTRVTAIVPGMDVTVREVELPAKSEAQARAVVPFMLEDEVAVDLDGLHFALGAQHSGGKRTVAIVAKASMDAWLSVLEPVRHLELKLVPDFMAASSADGPVRIIHRGSHVLVCLGANGGFAGEPELMKLAAGALVPGDCAVEIYSGEPDRLAPAGGWGARAVTEAAGLSDRAFFEMVLAGSRSGECLTLLQGAYGPREGWMPSLAVWRRAAVLAVAISVGYVALLASEAWRYDRLADDLEAKTEQAVRTALPEVKRVVNPRAQIRSALNDLRSGGSDSYIKLTGMLFESIRSLENVQLTSMRFDGVRNAISARVLFGSFSEVEGLKAEIAKRGGALEEGGSRQDSAGIVGDVTVRLP